jgi:dCMP deaminase
MNWDEYFINIANAVRLKSKDQSTKIGAVIVGNGNEIVSTGYNSFPRGINDNLPERQERPEKYYWMAHAEINSILNAVRIGVSTNNCTMYMSCTLPCPECARAIINAGIRKIVVGGGDSAKGGQYKETKNRSEQMFKEAGVEVVFFNQPPKPAGPTLVDVGENLL